MDGKTVAVWFSEGNRQEQLLRISLQLNMRMCNTKFRSVLPKAVLFQSDNTVKTKILRKKRKQKCVD